MRIKKILTALLLVMSSIAISQTNTFPTSGNVGIGINNPFGLLTLKSGAFDGLGGINLESYSSSSNSRRWQIRNDAITWGDFAIAVSPTQYGSPDNRVFYINSTGNVGIGTTSPEYKLDINGNFRSSFGSMVDWGYLKGFFSPANTGVWGFSQDNRFFTGIGGNVYGRGFSTNAMGIFNGSTTKEDVFLYNQNSPSADFLVLKASGNVGIGTPNPETILNIVGSGSAKGVKLQTTSDHATYFESSTNSNTVITRVQSNSNGGFVGTLTNQPFGIVSNGAFIINATTSGNVGIGTTTPGSYKLAVEGTIGARKLKVTQGSWADDVFKTNYKLMPITELENFIQKNNHLPGVPSEKEVKGKDIDISETQAMLLKKIEELTLYMIELKKENQKQDIIIKELRRRK